MQLIAADQNLNSLVMPGIYIKIAICYAIFLWPTNNIQMKKQQLFFDKFLTVYMIKVKN